MRRILLPTILLSLLNWSNVATALPFGSKPGKKTDDNDDDAAAQVRVRGTAAKVTKQLQSADDTSLLATVQTFVQDTSSVVLSSDNLQSALRAAANTTEMRDFLQSARRSLHRHPELMYDLPFTSEVIQTTLKELNISFTTGWARNTHPEAFPGPGGFGIVAHIGSMSADQPCVILRADMDALPILEATSHIDAFKSRQTGKMHACGHDGHVTMLLGAAAVLKQIEATLPGTVRLVFQPAEEGGAGMKRMIEEGVVEMEPRAVWGFGMHVWPTLPTGVVASTAGALMAATETFEIVIHGKGGHAAMPHLTIDPIVAAASFILNVQTLVSRTVSPLDSGVVSVTQVETPGDAFNVIPASTKLRGTIRSLGTESLLDLRSKVEHMLQSVSTMYNCNSTIAYMPDYYPPTVNDATLFDKFAAPVGALVSREGVVRATVPTMGGEDFAFLAQTIPSTFFFVGQGSGHQKEGDGIPPTNYGLHHPSFALDENVLPVGVELHTNLAIRALHALSRKDIASPAEEL